MQNNLISILIPFKNTSEFLSECLESIVKQTYENWELLIVDDGSTDTSFEIVEHYAKIDSRIHLFKNSGNGIIDALRLAFSKSSGEFITRMDSDDIMFANKLEVLISKLKNYGNKHIALGMVEYFSFDGIGDGYAKYEKWLNNLTKTGDNYVGIYKECVIPSPCWMVYRDDLIACDAFNPIVYPEDYDLAFRFFKQGLKCIPCNQVLHKWRDYSTRTSRTHEHYSENHFLELKLNYFLELNYNSNRPLAVWGAGNKGKTLVKLLQKAFVPFFWICDNPKKIGKDIYSVTLHEFSYLKELDNPQSIITVANVSAQKEIKAYFQKLNMLAMRDYFFFC